MPDIFDQLESGDIFDQLAARPNIADIPSHTPSARVMPQKDYSFKGQIKQATENPRQYLSDVFSEENKRNLLYHVTPPSAEEIAGMDKSFSTYMRDVVPRSAAGAIYGGLTFIPSFIKSQTDPWAKWVESGFETRPSKEMEQNAVNTLADLGRYATRIPRALAGSEKAKQEWAADPIGTGLGAAPLVKPAAKGVQATGQLGREVFTKAIGQAPEKLYASSLKMSTSEKLTQAERAKRIKTGLEEGIVPNEKGLSQLNSMIEETNKKIGETIKEGARQGGKVSVESIISRLDELKERAVDSFDWATDLADLDNLAESLRTHPKVINGAKPKQTFKEFSQGKMSPYMKEEGSHGAAMKRLSEEYKAYKEEPVNSEAMIPVDVAQQMKINAYRKLRRAYGEMKSIDVEGQKALARGVKEELVAQYPELQGLNAKDTALIGLEDSLSKAVKRIQNRDVMGIGGPIKLGAGSLAGKPGAIAGALAWLIDTPQVKARLAIALDRARTKGAKTPMLDATPKLSKDQRGATTLFTGGGDLNKTKVSNVLDKTVDYAKNASLDSLQVIREELRDLADEFRQTFNRKKEPEGKEAPFARLSRLERVVQGRGAVREIMEQLKKEQPKTSRPKSTRFDILQEIKQEITDIRDELRDTLRYTFNAKDEF